MRPIPPATASPAGNRTATLARLFERLAAALDASARLADESAEREERFGHHDRAGVERRHAAKARAAAQRARGQLRD